MQPRLHGHLWPIAIVSILATLLFLWITSAGVSIAPDSVAYLSAAENLIEGNGLTVSYGFDEPVPMTLYPPFYPWLLGSTVFALGVEGTSAARWLNAASFSATVFLAGCLVHAATQSLLLSLLGSIVVMSAAPMLVNHVYAQSDPLFLSLSLLGLFLLAKACEKENRVLLVLAATVFGLAFLTRLVGIALILTGIGMLMIPVVRHSPRLNVRRALADAGILVAIGILPTLIWTSWNQALAPRLADREFVFHLSAGKQATTLLSTIADLSLPMLSGKVIPGTSNLFRTAAYGFAAFLVLLTVLAIWRDRRKPAVKALFLGPLPICVQTLSLFLVCYVSVVAFSILFVDLETYFDMRISLPVYCCIVILSVSFLSRLRISRTRSTPWVTGMWILILTFLASQSAAGILWTSRNRGKPRGYASQAWRNSPLIARVRQLPDGTKIRSNMPDPILFLTARPVAWIPEKFNYTTGRPNHSYLLELSTMRRELHAGGVIVIFDQARRDWLAQTPELIHLLDLQTATVATDGRIFELNQ